MIIRILGEGQFDVPDDKVESLNKHDDELEQAVESGDEAGFAAALGSLLDEVRGAGAPVAVDELVSSDLILPAETATLSEVRDLLSGDGLIPG